MMKKKHENHKKNNPGKISCNMKYQIKLKKEKKNYMKHVIIFKNCCYSILK